MSAFLSRLDATDGEKHGFESLRAQCGDPERRGEWCVELERAAERENLVDLGAQQISRQPVLGNAEPHHAARFSRGFEDRDVVTADGEVVCCGETSRACADDGDLAATS